VNGSIWGRRAAFGILAVALLIAVVACEESLEETPALQPSLSPSPTLIMTPTSIASPRVVATSRLTPAPTRPSLVTVRPLATVRPQPPPTESTGRTESVTVVKYFDIGNKAIIKRTNGQQYQIEVGVGCLSLAMYEGRTVTIYYPGLFGGIGMKLIIPQRSQECRIWSAEPLS